MKTIRIALAQINTTVGDLAGNKRKILEYIAKAQQMSVDLIVFPELAITGYPPEDLLLKEHFVDDNLRILKEITSEVKNIVTIIGFVDKDKNGLLYNAAAVIHHGQLSGVYHKNSLPNYGVFDEKRYFTKGKDFQLFSYGGILFGVNICEDIWNPAGPCAFQVKAGARILLNLSASPYHCGKTEERVKVLSSCAKKNKAFICYCNLIGGQDELVFDGASMIVDPKGDVVSYAKAFDEDLLVADLKITPEKKAFRAKTRIVTLREKPLSEGRLLIEGKKEYKPLASEEIYQALVLGTRDYIVKNGFTKAVIGLSGGIDSALVAVIARDAIGRENVLGVSMPSPYTSKETQADARLVANNLGIGFEEISIKKLFDTYLKTLKPIFQGLKTNIAEENLQARIRGNILMALSNKLGHLVLTTGNKSEISVGYCTLYGDMAGGFAVIKDVPKTTVYQLAQFVNEKALRSLIPQSIIKRAPTAELKKNQRDQDSLPPYAVLDSVLEAYVEKDQGLKKIKDKKGGIHLAKRIMHLVDAMEYKRRQAPIGVKITPKAFGKDRRLPITNHYKES
jgi:NAD+ synthase (glutamine-hydrolysing)